MEGNPARGWNQPLVPRLGRPSGTTLQESRGASWRRTWQESREGKSLFSSLPLSGFFTKDLLTWQQGHGQADTIPGLQKGPLRERAGNSTTDQGAGLEFHHPKGPSQERGLPCGVWVCPWHGGEWGSQGSLGSQSGCRGPLQCSLLLRPSTVGQVSPQ